MIHSVFKEMAIGEFRIRINNRKVLRGLLQHFGVDEGSAPAVLRILDKVEKEDAAGIRAQLGAEGVKDADGLYRLISEKRTTGDTLSLLKEFSPCAEGADELARVAQAIRQFGVPDSAFAVDLGVVRGLDYYTGTIYETTLVGHPDIGSICSGGRYDDLASYFTDTRLPGVGISIGLTRLFAKLREANLLRDPARTPAEVLVTAMDAQYLDRYIGLARTLREAGINTELYLEAAKLGKQLEYADRKGFKVALIAGETEFGKNVVQLKDLRAKTAQDCRQDQLVGQVKILLGMKEG